MIAQAYSAASEDSITGNYQKDLVFLSDFPKPQVTRVAHDSCNRARQCVPVLSTNTTTVNTMFYDVDNVGRDVVGDQTYNTCDICDSCGTNIWISSMDIHGGADRFEKANRTE